MTSCLALLTVAMLLLSAASGDTCDQTVQLSYLNGAVYMLAKGRYELTGKPKDCLDLLRMGHHESGAYTIWPANRLLGEGSLEVYCDMETDGGGWTVLQRRGNFGSPENYFFQDWDTYKKGFGDTKKDFWLGNDNIFALTSQRLYSARFDLQDFENNTAFAKYDTFWIDDENHQYTLHVAGYTGDAGDSLASYHDNQKFSTKDRDNDNRGTEHCAHAYKGAWWYEGCHNSNLNGLYLTGASRKSPAGLNWITWRGSKSLAGTEIKIRPWATSIP